MSDLQYGGSSSSSGYYTDNDHQKGHIKVNLRPDRGLKGGVEIITKPKQPKPKGYTVDVDLKSNCLSIGKIFDDEE